VTPETPVFTSVQPYAYARARSGRKICGPSGDTALWLLLVVVVLLVILVLRIYKGLVSLKLHCDDAWAGFDVHLKRRYDLIPIVVEAAKRCVASHTKVGARSRCHGAQKGHDQRRPRGKLEIAHVLYA
jgi:hypothetical protein